MVSHLDVLDKLKLCLEVLWTKRALKLALLSMRHDERDGLFRVQSDDAIIQLIALLLAKAWNKISNKVQVNYYSRSYHFKTLDYNLSTSL